MPERKSLLLNSYMHDYKVLKGYIPPLEDNIKIMLLLERDTVRVHMVQEQHTGDLPIDPNIGHYHTPHSNESSINVHT